MANMIFLDALNYKAETPLEKCIVLYWAKGCNGKGVLSEKDQRPLFSIDDISTWCGALSGHVFDAIKALHEKQVIIDISNSGGCSPIWQLNLEEVFV